MRESTHTHTPTQHPHLQLPFQLMETLRVRAYLYVSVFVCVYIFFTINFGWVQFSVLEVWIFVTSIFSSEVNCARSCVRCISIAVYLFHSNRSVNPTPSLLSPSLFLSGCLSMRARVCVCFWLVKTHSFICTLSLLFQMLLCVNLLHIFWTK